MEKTTKNTKMWSYKMTWDTMFAPNPLWNVLTLATCKPTIRKSPNTVKGMWIAGWTACTLHNSPVNKFSVQKIKKGEEQLIYLAQIDDILTLDEYWEKYPQKRCVMGTSPNDAHWYGDNIYHMDADGTVIQAFNNNGHEGEDATRRDYYNGKNALICNRFYYFTPDKRLRDIPSYFRKLIHGGVGQSIKRGEIVDDFIEFVSKCALEDGVTNGIVGTLPITYPDLNSNVSNNIPVTSHNVINKKKGGCSL